MEFSIIFLIVGLIWIIFIILILILADKKYKLGATVVCFGLLLIMSLGLYYDTKTTVDSWNEGYCGCGEHWELRGVTRNKHGSVTKYYVCPNCHIEIEQ